MATAFSITSHALPGGSVQHLVWDVARALALVWDRVPNASLLVEPWAPLVRHRIDPDRMANLLREDLEEPLLLVPNPIDPAGLLLVDGCHRTWLAHREGVGRLPAHVLSPEEASTCLVDSPPALRPVQVRPRRRTQPASA